MKRRGYTIVELLIVIAIIGLLVTLGTYAWNSSGQRSRDSVRKSDLSRINNALQQFYLDNRSYPDFDNSAGSIFTAGYQLYDKTKCLHGSEKSGFLTSKYLFTIPQDPRGSTDFKDDLCTDLEDQHNQYLYLTNRKDSPNPRGFALMATLENINDPDQLGANENPVLDSGYMGTFKDYYVGGGPQTNFDPNYMITGSNGR